VTALLKTSHSSPLRIAETSVSPLDGRLGLTLCPGKKDRSQGWDQDLATDVRGVRNWGATTVLTLIEEHEFRLLAIEAFAEEVQRFGMEWLHLPIRDVDIPDERFEQS
jgi:ADP-ribosyl-[dinitrogen reductase] hydrolase